VIGGQICFPGTRSVGTHPSLFVWMP
jgi:hypothetical protein